MPFLKFYLFMIEKTRNERMYQKKTINVVAAIICKDDKIMIAKRGYGEFEGMYEFPGGKIEPGETPENALIRELK